MENQEFNKDLLEYLYGEMDAQTRKEFEQKLQTDSQLQEELKELKSVRKELENLKDKEIMEPFSAWGRPRSTNWFNGISQRRIIVFRPVTAVAATILILFMAGYLTNFSMTISGNGLSMGFGNQVAQSDQKYFTEDDVKAIVSQELQKNNEILLAKLNSYEQSNNTKLAAFEADLESLENGNRNNEVTRNDLQNFFTNAENRNAETMKEYLRQTSTQQQEYLTAMFNQFNNFYKQQRDDDLMFIQNSIYDLTQKQAIQKQETDKAFARLYSSTSEGGN